MTRLDQSSLYRKQWKNAEIACACALSSMDVFEYATTQSHEVSKNFPLIDTSRTSYSLRHINNEYYGKNNWLVDQDSLKSQIPDKVVLEIGCGNGHFSRLASATAREVHGVDWVRSPRIRGMPRNFYFHERNAVTDVLPHADIACSADFLEHIATPDLHKVLTKMHNAAAQQYHVIACYHDNDSHQSVLRPGIWLALFRTLSADYELHSVALRRGLLTQPVCVVTRHISQA